MDSSLVLMKQPERPQCQLGSRESKTKRRRTDSTSLSVAEMISLAKVGKKPRELNWSSLVGTCALIYYYICMYMFVSDLPTTVLEYTRS